MQDVHKSPYSDIIKLVRTTTEAKELLSSLEDIMHALFQINTSFDDALNKFLPRQYVDAVKQYITTQKFNTSEKQTLKPFFEDLSDYVRALPEISLVLSFVPTDDVLTTISLWVKKELSGEVIIHYTTDRSLLGGAVITYGGIYKDMSLKKILEETFVKKKEQFQALFA